MLRAEVRVKGHIAAHWSSWFEGLAISHGSQGDTLLSGDVLDQAALYGLLAKLRDLGLVLISVNSYEVPRHDAAGHPPGTEETRL